MNWTEHEFLESVKLNNSTYDYELIIKLIAKIKEDDRLFIIFGKGKKVPTLNIYVKKLSEKYLIIGIESKPRSTGITAWINLAPHEANKDIIWKVRDFLGEYKKLYPKISSESISELIYNIDSILNILICFKSKPPFSVKSRGASVELFAQTVQEQIPSPTTSVETFDALYARWEEQALRKAKFEAEKVVGKELMPGVVKRKVARLWEMGICYPDDLELASFRLTDSKRGGPYNCFSYYPSNKTIYLNREYLVQLAAFLDLIDDYGYLPQWMTFEHNESTPVAAVSIDIGIKLPDGRKIFVEVKERKDQREALISAVKSLGTTGVDLSVKDRSNDPLRKAKYILSGRPDFFAVYSPEGFDTYRVTNQVGDCFTLEHTDFPHAQSFKFT